MSPTDNTLDLPHHRQLEIGLVSHGDASAAADLLILAISQNDILLDEVNAYYEVYRNGPGWSQLYAGLTGSQQDMAAAHTWWLDNQNSPLVLGYRTLLAFDPELNLTRFVPTRPGLAPDAVVNALMDLRMFGLHPDGTFGLTTRADAVLLPALLPAGPAALQQFAAAMTAALGKTDDPVRRAFPALRPPRDRITTDSSPATSSPARPQPATRGR